jgi:hypothetical protein
MEYNGRLREKFETGKAGNLTKKFIPFPGKGEGDKGLMRMDTRTHRRHSRPRPEAWEEQLLSFPEYRPPEIR